MRFYKCREGHVSGSLDCPYCQKIKVENEGFDKLMEDIVENGN
jgi:hypothetical protein